MGGDRKFEELGGGSGAQTVIEKRIHGKTAHGVPITDELVEKLAAEAEDGYDVEETLRRRSED